MGLDEIKDKAADALGTVKEKAGDLGEKAKEVFEDIKDKASDVVEDVKDRFEGDDTPAGDTGDAVTETSAAGDTIVDLPESDAAGVPDAPLPGDLPADGTLDATEDSAAGGIPEPVTEVGTGDALDTSQDVGEPLDPTEGTPLDTGDQPGEFRSNY